MANKVSAEEELRDEFLSGIVRSDETLHLPLGFTDEVMNRISMIPMMTKPKPYNQYNHYKAPGWLKWGVPGVIIVCLIGLVISGPAPGPAATESVATRFEKATATINSWLTGFNVDIQFPDMILSGTILWVLAGGIVLTWSFVLLFRFLEKKARQ